MARMTWKKRMCVIGAAVLFAVVVTSYDAKMAEAKAAFPSKTITYIVPVSPGGGFDTYSRMIIPYLQKYLPGKPNIIIKNTPGGEWSIGITKMYRSKPDGHTICIFNMPANAVNQVLGEAEFDLTKVTWLGNLGEVTYVAALSTKTKYKTLKEFQEAREVTCGTVGLASTAGLGALLAAQRMGIKMKFIPHAGSTEAILAGIRGDVDWVQYPISTLKKSIVDSKDLIPFVVYAKKRLKLLPDVPTIGELGYPDLLDVVSMTRPVGAPPGLPQDVAKLWRDAFAQATGDQEFQKKQMAANESPLPMTAKELEEMVVGAIKMITPHKNLILQHRK